MPIQRKRLFWLGVALFALGLAFLVLPPYSAYCKANDTNEYYCAAYKIVVAFGGLIESYSAAFTALATVAIAGFTLTLKRSTDKLWLAGERQFGHAQAEAIVAESGRKVQSQQIGEQIEALRQSADATMQSGIATRDLVRTARENAQLELRAYIGIESIKITSNDWGNTFWVEAQIKNAGKTPAFRVTHCITHQILKDPTLNLRMPNRSPGNLPIAPDMSFTLRTPVVIGAAGGTGFIDTGQRFIIAWGKVDYFDFFGFPHYLTFRFRSTEPVRAHDGTIMRTVGWTMHPEDEGNDAN
jgi:hypothetical protein